MMTHEDPIVMLHDRACRLHTFCTINPAVGSITGISALFMSNVNDAISETKTARAIARRAIVRERKAAIGRRKARRLRMIGRSK